MSRWLYITLHLFLACIMALMVTSCNFNKARMELNLENGKTYMQNMICNVGITQAVMGRKSEMSMTIKGKLSYKVLQADEEGYEMEVRYVNMAMVMSLPSRILEFSSEKHDEEDILSNVLALMKDKPFNIRMSKKGRVTDIRNLESLFSSAFELLPKVSHEQKIQTETRLLRAYGEKTFRNNLETATAIFPEDNVGRGDHWKVSSNINAGMRMKIESNFELKDMNEKQFIITGNSKLKCSDDDAFIPTNGMPMSFDMAGDMVSDVKVDRSTGWITDAKIRQNMTGTARVKMSRESRSGVSIPMTMNNLITFSN